jgi:hypothetical protein
MTISKDILDELLKGCERPEDLPGDAGLMQDVLLAVVPSRGLQANHCRVINGLKGFPEAITAAFPDATVQPGLRPFRADALHPASSTWCATP